MNRQLHSKKPDTAAPAGSVDQLLDDYLAAPTEQLAPSSGFVLSVMEAVHAQAAEPPPLAFPWRRVLPGAVAMLCALAAFAAVVFRAARTGASLAPAAQSQPALAIVLTPGEATLCWVLLATCLSLAAAAASFRLAGRS